MLSDDGLLCRMSGTRPGIGWHCSQSDPCRFLLHAADRTDGVLSSEDEAKEHRSGRREIQNVAPPKGAPSLVRPVLLSK